MGCQFSQIGGAVTHLQIKLVALALQQFFFALPRLQQRAGLHEVQVKSQQARQCHDGNADSGELQRSFDQALSAFHFQDAASGQPGAEVANCIHVLLTDVCGHDKFPGIFVAVLAHAHAKVHFNQFSRHMPGQRSIILQLLLIGADHQSERIEFGPYLRCCRAVGLEVADVPCKQVPALSGFGVKHMLQ